MYGKSNMETYITMCQIDSQWEFAVWLRKLKQGLCINVEGWDEYGVGGRLQRKGIYVYLWLIHKLESRLLREISITSDMQMTTPLWQKVKRNSKAS